MKNLTEIDKCTKISRNLCSFLVHSIAICIDSFNGMYHSNNSLFIEEFDKNFIDS